MKKVIPHRKRYVLQVKSLFWWGKMRHSYDIEEEATAQARLLESFGFFRYRVIDTKGKMKSREARASVALFGTGLAYSGIMGLVGLGLGFPWHTAFGVPVTISLVVIVAIEVTAYVLKWIDKGES